MVLNLPGSWVGWKIHRTGRRKNESLIAPDGTEYSPGEVQELRAMQYEIDFLQVENKRLNALIETHAVHLTTEQVEALQKTAEIIEAVLPQRHFARLRWCQSRAPRLAPLPTRHNVKQETRHNPPVTRNMARPLPTRASDSRRGAPRLTSEKTSC